MFTRKSKPVEDRVHRVVESTGRAPEPRHEDEPPGDFYRAAAPGPIPPRRIVEPEPEPELLYPPPGRDAAPIDQVSSLRHNVMQRVESEPDKEESVLAARLRRNWLRDRPDPLMLGAVVVIAAVVGLVMLSLLFRGGSKKSSTAQSPTVVAAQPSSAPAGATSAAGAKPSSVPATASSAIFSAQTPVVTPAAARPAASPPAAAAQPSAAQPGAAARSTGAAQGSGLGPSASNIVTATPAPGSTPPVTRPARSAPLAPPAASPTAEPGQSLANVVGNAAASQPPPVAAQVGTSSPGQVSIPGVTTSTGSSARAGVAPARSSVGSGASSVPAAVAAAPQPTTIAPNLDTIAAQTSRAAGAAASRGGH